MFVNKKDRICMVLLVLLLFVSVLPTTVAATSLAPEENLTTNTAETVEGSLLNLLLGDVEQFIENELRLFTGEAAELNMIIFIIACVAVMLIPAGVFLWGAAKPLKVILDFICEVARIVLQLVVILLDVLKWVVERFWVALKSGAKEVANLIHWAKGGFDSWINKVDAEKTPWLIPFGRLVSIWAVCVSVILVVYLNEKGDTIGAMGAAVVCLALSYVCGKFCMKFAASKPQNNVVIEDETEK